MSTTSKVNVVSLMDADLRAVKWERADLNSANLCEVSLVEAGLTSAELSNANLYHANLYFAKVTDKQLAKAKSLAGATMPDGTKHP